MRKSRSVRGTLPHPPSDEAPTLPSCRPAAGPRLPRVVASSEATQRGVEELRWVRSAVRSACSLALHRAARQTLATAVDDDGWLRGVLARRFFSRGETGTGMQLPLFCTHARESI